MYAASSKENSWDNRESIHVCQADLKLFPSAQQWGNRAERYVGAAKAVVRDRAC